MSVADYHVILSERSESKDPYPQKRENGSLHAASP